MGDSIVFTTNNWSPFASHKRVMELIHGTDEFQDEEKQIKELFYENSSHELEENPPSLAKKRKVTIEGVKRIDTVRSEQGPVTAHLLNVEDSEYLLVLDSTFQEGDVQ